MNTPIPNDLSSLSLDELEVVFHANRGDLRVADEYLGRLRTQNLQYRAFMQKVLQARRHPFIAVIDIEATCYDSPHDAELPPEIIEIGIAILDMASFEVVKRYQQYVRPQLGYISEFCTKLTGITAETVKAAPPFRIALSRVAEHLQYFKVSEEAPTTPITYWASHGEADPNYFKHQTQRENLDNPFESLEHLNVKELAAVFFGLGKKKAPGMHRALALAGLELEGRHHSGVDDAFNTAKLLAYMLKKPY